VVTYWGVTTVESLVCLEYPNGRRSETTVARARSLRVGDEFDLHGRRWRAIGPVRRGHYEADDGRIVCTSIGRIAPPT
jgi:hypothetical protein